jgi:YfiH family protein
MSEPLLQHHTSLLHIKKWEKIDPCLIAGFTTRQGGVSASPFASFNFGFHVGDDKTDVLQNRGGLAGKLEMPLENWISGEQTHETNIHIIDHDDKGKGAMTNETAIGRTDGLITNQRGMLCTAFFADCVPLFFFDPVTGYIGIAHAGWKGTVGRIAGKMVKQLETIGVNPHNLCVVIGPCISQEKYEVDQQVISHIAAEERKHTVVSKGDNRYLLDLKQLNTEILLQSGVLRNNIDITEYCTFRDEALFYSHRRDKGRTGRMLGYIGYKEKQVQKRER